MAKATAKKIKLSLNQRRSSYFYFNNIIILTNKKGEVISWSSAGKWVLEVLKEHSICSPNGSRRL
jgi:ribosomal protein S11